MNFQDIIKPFTVIPATQSDESPWNKGYTRVAGGFNRLSKFIQIPANLTNDVPRYKRRLMFQFNLSFDADLYLINLKQLANFASLYLLGGCLCVKWRVGETVYRYRILDYRSDINWSFFPLYTNQKIKKNFCIEFWIDDVVFAAGITQDLYLQTDQLRVPASIDDSADLFSDADLQSLADLVQPFPLAYPIDYSNQAFLDNV